MAFLRWKFDPCMDFSFINEPSGFLNMFTHLNIFWQLVSQFNYEFCGKSSSPLMIPCWLMIWVPYSAMRNVHLQLSFVFSFSLLFFSSQGYFIIFCLLAQKNNLLIILVILHKPGWFYPILLWSRGSKHALCSKWCYTVDLYSGIITFSLSPLIFLIFLNVDSAFLPLPLNWCSQGAFFRDHMKKALFSLKMLVSVFLHSF